MIMSKSMLIIQHEKRIKYINFIAENSYLNLNNSIICVNCRKISHILWIAGMLLRN